MQEAFRALLIQDAAVSALVESRVSWAVLPRSSSLPAITLHLIDGIPDYNYTGPSGLVVSRVQADCWGKSYADAVNVSRAVKTKVSGFKGTVKNVSFDAVFVLMERDTPDDSSQPNELLFCMSIDFQVWHKEI